MTSDTDFDGKKLSDVPLDVLTWVIVEHRRRILGGTKHSDYGTYATWDEAERVREQLEDDPEFGVSYSIEHRVK